MSGKQYVFWLSDKKEIDFDCKKAGFGAMNKKFKTKIFKEFTGTGLNVLAKNRRN